MPRLPLLLPAVLLLAQPSQAQAQAQIVSGPAQATDGDSLEMTGFRIRLHGVDAPEAAQTCQRKGAVWACGQASKALLAQLVAGKTVRCEQRDQDKYGRLVSACYAANQDLGEAMVAAGLAVALPEFSTAYVAQEARARALKLGVWSSVFDMPAAYRAAHPREEPAARAAALPRVTRHATGPTRRSAPVATAHQGGCTIKGNHSRRGDWIYHLPGMPYYERTRAEAMFCTEAQAKAAGYRRAIVRR